jgi:membrane-bound lytic murein transglycosylase F
MATRALWRTGQFGVAGVLHEVLDVLPETPDQPLAALRRTRLDGDGDGVLRVALPDDGLSWYLIDGRVAGFEHDLLHAFAADHGLRLEVVAVTPTQERYASLVRGEVDLTAGALSSDPTWASHVAWSSPVATSPLVAVQGMVRHGSVHHPWLARQDDLGPVWDPLGPGEGPVYAWQDVVGRPVAVAASAGWAKELAAWPSGPLPVRLTPGETTAETLDLVHDGHVGVAVLREDLAALELPAYPGLEVAARLPASASSRIAFRLDDAALHEAFEAWRSRRGRLIGALERRYLKDVRAYQARRRAPTFTAATGRLSAYDDLFRRHGPRIGWDWRLLAAVCYQESHFQRYARSFAGAMGLMQIMPGTARDLGVTDAYEPAQAVRGGADYLAWLETQWEGEVPPGERLSFVLASYNAGIGHVWDARRLAAAAGDDPDAWNQVAPWMIKLMEPRWYKHPVVRYGYVRGTEPVAYVSSILARYQHYRQLVDEVSIDVDAVAAAE